MKINDLNEIDFKDPPTVAVYRKTKKSKSYYMLVTRKGVDIINNSQAKKPLIDHKYEIIDLGIGKYFIKNWSNKYKIKEVEFVE